MARQNLAATLLVICLACTPALSSAETWRDPVIVKPQPISEVWLNAGFLSLHYDKNVDLNNRNFGLGGTYRYSTVSAYTLGVFKNSDYQTSSYLGWFWQPIAWGKIRLGAVVGALDGYPEINNGGWYLAAIPTVSVEHQDVGLNLLVIPGIKNRLYGSFSLQLKFKVF